MWILYLIIYLIKWALGSTETVLNVSSWTCHDYLCLKMTPMFFCSGNSGDGCDWSAIGAALSWEETTPEMGTVSTTIFKEQRCQKSLSQTKRHIANISFKNPLALSWLTNFHIRCGIRYHGPTLQGRSDNCKKAVQEISLCKGMWTRKCHWEQLIASYHCYRS